MGQFVDYLQSFGSKCQLLVIAHNAKSFDGIFLLQELIARHIKPDLTLQGAKILQMKAGNWKMIDSLSFMPMALSALPKAFGLPPELKKGWFPYLMNEPKYYKYEGRMPDRKLYAESGMKAKAAADFGVWYEEQLANNYVFNFRRELVDYCVSDVTILRQACQAFRTLFSDIAGFDPMFERITLSSACMAAFRRNFLQEGKIGIVPPGGYHGRGKQSHIALKWLDYEAHKRGHKIQTIYTSREVMVMGRPVDGYAEVPRPDGTVEKIIFQFHGDYWHGCPKHFPLTKESSVNRYENTMHLTALFRRSGYTVVEKWECDFRAELLNDPAAKAFFEAHPTTRVPPLNLRDGLAGGRTTALRCYHKIDLEKQEKIKMADVVSEYPAMCLFSDYPWGIQTCSWRVTKVCLLQTNGTE